jgi:hypothetical protein
VPYSPELPEKPSAVELRSALEGAGDYLNGLRTAETRDENWAADVRSAVDFVNLVDPMLTAVERGERAPSVSQGPAVATAASPAPEFRTVGEMLVGADDYETFAREGRSGSSAYEFRVDRNIRAQEYRALLASSSESEWLPRAAQAIAPTVRERRLFVRDVLGQAQTTLSSIPYIRESHAGTPPDGSANSTAEGSAKNETAMAWSQEDAPVRKITAWLPATTEIIEDAPTLRAYIDQRLEYEVSVAEETQLLSGNGTAPNLRGILNHTGVQSQAFTTDATISIGLGISKIEEVDGAADGIAIRPTDFWQIVTQRNANQFDGGFSVGAPFGAPAATLWGLPAIRTRAVAADTAVVGNWRQGATIFDRAETTIRVGNQHSTYFVENKVAIVAECRLALAVHRPDYFCSVALVSA